MGIYIYVLVCWCSTISTRDSIFWVHGCLFDGTHHCTLAYFYVSKLLLCRVPLMVIVSLHFHRHMIDLSHINVALIVE